MSERKRDEKDEKGEKEEEKKREKEEKWQRDRVNALMWAAVLVWAALVILAETTDFAYDNFRGWWEAWAVFFAGAGAIVLLSTFYRMLVPEYRRPIAGGLILGFIFLGVGLGELVGWDYIWVIVLIAIAITIVARAFLPKAPRPQ